MNPKALKYLLDIESVIEEIELLKIKVENNFNLFQQDFIIKRATERDLEIIGEAVKNFIKIEPAAKITSSKKIVGLRNMISHAYDAIDNELIWAIIQRDVPILSREVQLLKSQNNLH